MAYKILLRIQTGHSVWLILWPNKINKTLLNKIYWSTGSKQWVLHNYHETPTTNKYKSQNIKSAIDNMPSKMEFFCHFCRIEVVNLSEKVNQTFGSVSYQSYQTDRILTRHCPFFCRRVKLSNTTEITFDLTSDSDLHTVLWYQQSALRSTD